MAGTYRVKVKGGDYGYKDGVYGVQDYVKEYTDLGEALQDFLEWTDASGDDTVTLRFRPNEDDE